MTWAPIPLLGLLRVCLGHYSSMLFTVMAIYMRCCIALYFHDAFSQSLLQYHLIDELLYLLTALTKSLANFCYV